MKRKSKLRFEDLPKKYAALCRLLLPRPIHNEVEYDLVAELTGALAGHDEEFSGDQADYYALLCWLIEEYDLKHGHRSRLTGLDILKRLMKERCMSPADLSDYLGGNRSLAAGVLRGERQLTLRHVRLLARRFGVSADNFLG
jgi:HTH-type transcriptional regulator / antitoxin HigA